MTRYYWNFKVWGQIGVLGRNGDQVRDDLRQQYRRMKRQFSELTGYLAEVYMAPAQRAAANFAGAIFSSGK